MNTVIIYRQQKSIFLCVHLCISFVPQLRAALYDIYDIFFEMPLGDRLALLQQDRELRAERKLRDMVTLKYISVMYVCTSLVITSPVHFIQCYLFLAKALEE